MSIYGAAPGTHPFWENIFIRNSFSFGALIWLGWEGIITFPDEYKYIWKGERSHIRLLYFFMKYYALSGQTLNHALTVVLLSKAPLTPSVCRGWYAYQVAIMQSLYTSLQYVLVLRVYALYDRSFRVGILLSSLFITEFAVMLSTGVATFIEFKFDATCLIETTPPPVLIMGITNVVVQMTIWGMTLLKLYANGSKHSPLMRIVIRDGGIVWAVLTAFFSVAIPYTYLVSVLTHSMFTFLITVLSIMGCRLIMNMQRLKSPQQNPGTGVMLTTVLPQCEESSEGSIDDQDISNTKPRI